MFKQFYDIFIIVNIENKLAIPVTAYHCKSARGMWNELRSSNFPLKRSVKRLTLSVLDVANAGPNGVASSVSFALYFVLCTWKGDVVGCFLV